MPETPTRLGDADGNANAGPKAWPRADVGAAGLSRRGASTALAGVLLCISACSTLAPPPAHSVAAVPVLSGWFDGEEVFYITTDVSHADVAQAKGANFAPRLAHALPAGAPVPGRPSSVDKVFAVTNFKQASVFASAPFPMGAASRDTAYSPLWQMVKVTWAPGPHAADLEI